MGHLMSQRTKKKRPVAEQRTSLMSVKRFLEKLK